MNTNVPSTNENNNAPSVEEELAAAREIIRKLKADKSKLEADLAKAQDTISNLQGKLDKDSKKKTSCLQDDAANARLERQHERDIETLEKEIKEIKEQEQAREEITRSVKTASKSKWKFDSTFANFLKERRRLDMLSNSSKTRAVTSTISESNLTQPVIPIGSSKRKLWPTVKPFANAMARVKRQRKTGEALVQRKKQLEKDSSNFVSS